jgi:SPW repeat-containing protein
MATYYTSGLVSERRSNRLEDWVVLVVSVWFFISPWVLQFGTGVQPGAAPVAMVSAAAWDAWVMSVLVFLTALAAISRLEVWQEWLNLIFGAWIIIAPWALDFSAAADAGWDHWIVGAVIFLISLWSLSTARTAPATPIEPPVSRDRPSIQQPSQRPPSDPLV